MTETILPSEHTPAKSSQARVRPEIFLMHRVEAQDSLREPVQDFTAGVYLINGPCLYHSNS